MGVQVIDGQSEEVLYGPIETDFKIPNCVDFATGPGGKVINVTHFPAALQLVNTNCPPPPLYITTRFGYYLGRNQTAINLAFI